MVIFDREHYIPYLNRRTYHELICFWGRSEKRLFYLLSNGNTCKNKPVKKAKYKINLIKEVLKEKKRESYDEILELKSNYKEEIEQDFELKLCPSCGEEL